MLKQKSVLVALSGGVDSSVAAKLLVDAGYQVIGATLAFFDARSSRQLQQIQAKNIEDARCVCEALGIAHRVIDCADEFRLRVIRPFCDSYMCGQTPNPCFGCNPRMKFAVLLRAADELGCALVASGHYAQKLQHPQTGLMTLARAQDDAKDQSYVLAGIWREQLARICFPLGKFSKPQVRTCAAQAALPVATKRESQDICFIPDKNYRAFVEAHSDDAPVCGEIVNARGEVLGVHGGLHRYTIGQRKGIGLAAREPYYVIDKDWKNKRLVVGFADELLSEELIVTGMNFLGIDARAFGREPLRVWCKTSYRHAAQPAQVRGNAQQAQVHFDIAQRKTAAGQAVVFYDENGFVLAGGIASATSSVPTQ